MTVAELIEKLKAMPQDAEARVWGAREDEVPVDNARLDRDCRDGSAFVIIEP